MHIIDTSTVTRLAEAAHDRRPVSGLTHNFYRYPARFSPQFAAAAIECFSKPGDLVLDPYMGGGTTVLEAMAAGRQAIGSDINQLAVFVVQAKVTTLSKDERHAVRRWANEVVPTLKCNIPARSVGWIPRNMSLPVTRWLRKAIALLLASLETELHTEPSRRFGRCIILNVGQWALNGRKRLPTAAEFRDRVSTTAIEMLNSIALLQDTLDEARLTTFQPLLRENDAELIDHDPVITAAQPVDLVVTSPPYPGIHLLYHRWQVDGRKETDAPYWIAACNDGEGSSYYNFADRRQSAEDRYFEKARQSFSAVRRVMRKHALLVQMIAFSKPDRQLRRYLQMMQCAGFAERREHGQHRIWRDVPGRRWHASLKGQLSSSREVVLVHEAI